MFFQKKKTIISISKLEKKLVYVFQIYSFRLIIYQYVLDTASFFVFFLLKLEGHWVTLFVLGLV